MSKVGFLNFKITNCTFTKNYGLNVAQGSAIYVDGKQDHVWEKAFRFKVTDFIKSLVERSDDVWRSTIWYGKNKTQTLKTKPKHV